MTPYHTVAIWAANDLKDFTSSLPSPCLEFLCPALSFNSPAALLTFVGVCSPTRYRWHFPRRKTIKNEKTYYLPGVEPPNSLKKKRWHHSLTTGTQWTGCFNAKTVTIFIFSEYYCGIALPKEWRTPSTADYRKIQLHKIVEL